MIRPYPQVRAGDNLSASELNRLFNDIYRLTQIQVRAPLTLEFTSVGPLLGIRYREAIWARITGPAAPCTTTGSGSGTGAASFGSGDCTGAFATGAAYNGIEQSDTPLGVIDANGGKVFCCDYLLIEVSGNTQVPVNSIVRAYPSQDGTYYTFLFAESGGGAGGSTNAKIIRTLQYADGSTGNNFIIDPGTGVFFWPAIETNFDPVSGDILDVGPLVWLVPIYQANIPSVGGSIAANVPLLFSDHWYTGIDQGSTYSLTPNDVGGELAGAYSAYNHVADNWQVWATTDYPAGIRITCTGSPPTDQLQIGP